MVEVRTLKEGNYIKIDGEPCKITNKTSGKTSKHGGAKATVIAVGVFDGKKREYVGPVSSNVEVPMILKKKGQVVSIQGDIAQIMDLESYEMFDLSTAGEKLKEGEEVAYIDVEGRKALFNR
ncbi:MAG: translation initiation factor IF-5A [Candidatus Aenigmatarchaeota archaeon]|nr:MAG: translation initiation factor IF-5A [Candidatus Aenigmarchaeota archaeon]